jgi:hypothetical protein
VSAPLHVRLASGFRWRLPFPAAERDVLRLRVDAGVSVLAIANAYDSGFSTCWLPGSRLILDRFEEAWAAGSGPVADRLRAAFAAARAAFVAESALLVAYDDPADAAGATLHVVALDGAVAHAAWIGGEQAVVARGFQVAATTTPHTLAERFRAEGGEPPPANLAHIVTRTIRVDDHGEPPSTASFALAPGDTVIVTGRVHPPAAELAVAAGGFLSPVALAERIAAASDATPFTAALVARVDGFDLASTIETLVDGYVPDPRHGAELGDWARAQRALPVWFDVRGILALRGDGSVISRAWDEPGRSLPADEPTWHRAVSMVIGREPALAALAVTRPPEAADCALCMTKAFAAAGASCPACQGLGWELPPPPAWLRPASTGRTR